MDNLLNLDNTAFIAADEIYTEAICCPANDELPKDYFIVEDGVKFAGRHLIVDLWGASRIDDPEHIDAALCEAALAAGATILHHHFHHFTPNGGVSGVVVLAESHISIHTWPERDYAAIDIFMCGTCDPRDAIPVLQKAFSPAQTDIDLFRRGSANLDAA